MGLYLAGNVTVLAVSKTLKLIQGRLKTLYNSARNTCPQLAFSVGKWGPERGGAEGPLHAEQLK